MLKSLKLNNVGPAPKMELTLSNRLNLITGDNGLGKSFLLDVMWWALTRRWPHDLNPDLTSGYIARPRNLKEKATISYSLRGKTGKNFSRNVQYIPRDEMWKHPVGRPSNPGLVIYAHSDGGFSVWDPARNYWKNSNESDLPDRVPGYVFSSRDIWEGLDMTVGGEKLVVCNGLLRDWAGWIKEKGKNADLMSDLLTDLSPDEEFISTGPLVRLSINDARDIPSIKTVYSDSVPILHASSGVKRIVALAYMPLWSWNEHVMAAELIGEEVTSNVTVLFDEIESHLHPRWQRSILRSLLRVVEKLHKDASVQVVATTHSPLILASVETLFDDEKDAWFDLDCSSEKDYSVSIERKKYIRRGNISNWLTSEAFDLKEARSLEAEEAIIKAFEILKSSSPEMSDVEEVSKLLKDSLGEIDPFWLRWSSFKDSLENGNDSRQSS